MLKHSDEEEDLLRGPSGCAQAERSEERHEVAEVASDPWHEFVDIQVVYPEFLNVGQSVDLT